MRLGAAALAALLVTLTLGACGAGTSSSSSSPPATTATGAGTGDTTATSTSTGAPAPLTATKGYATYEACRGTCTGSVPASLRRPLKLPDGDGGPCPITVGAAGPVSPHELSGGVGFHSVPGSQWLGTQVTWLATGAYAGPILIRGAMLGGAGRVGFGTAVKPYDELQLLDAGRGAPRVAGNGRAWVTYSRIRSGGCYAYQVDGTGFSEVIVFRAVG